MAFYSEAACAYVGPPAAIGALGAVLSLTIAILGMVVHGAAKATRHLFQSRSTAVNNRSPIKPTE
ncbi:MAG: hypothetical protein WDN69_28425 [Aliidongia sp.]